MRDMLALTGSRAAEAGQVHLELATRYGWLSSMDGFVTGGCEGFDAIAGQWLFLMFPNKEHVVIVPGNRSQVDYWWINSGVQKIIQLRSDAHLNVFYMATDSTYKDRNQLLVDTGDRLFYYAEYPETHGRSRRSGTWQTVRMARRAVKEQTGVIVHEEDE